MKYDGTLRITFLSAAFLLLALVTLSFGREDHKGYMDLKPGECTECHQGSDVVPNHGAFWMKEHRLPAQKATSNCADCHQQSWCLDCHVGGGIEPDLKKSLSRRGEYMPKTHRSDFVSIHSVKAADNPQNCYRCHESSFCSDCHGRTRQKGNMNIRSHRKAGSSQLYDWNSDHAAEARRNLQSCESCHPDADVCVVCHRSGLTNPHPRNWRDISKRYKDESGGRTCRKCHITF
ncbi:MAG: hypothetical protein A2Z26_00955 [Deltaproteobacteria bacterium RBG_16_66_15]|nr:MAG: hypothetical protein A2X90_05785 [Deltaproteobacteria bacterium GWA2_65_63]OGP28930.1 MAG: hypothetical protein A2X91_10745 [Deltaproteobacteria bacterium GWB2_65_81]OGP36340.1 MAG: hypothetical protein A2X98_05615 [Deltaproteobacteria bacterium GWC2_66_88]OGP79533.1 MAG: hypothetical protein A2Z26_00955 [Deltaproteobacteria bacterium RBG_16_66_15]HAM34125.1 cytochrome C [Deltaproteobacteria bacterium]